MAELSFTSKLTWSGGSQGVVETGGQSLQFSVPASMGGLGVGASPEELLLSAVGSCYTATMACLTEARRLPAASIEVRVEGTVSDNTSTSVDTSPDGIDRMSTAVGA